MLLKSVEKMNELKIQEKEDLLTLVARYESKGKEFKYINDHNGRVEILQGYVILDDMYFCPVIKDTVYYCLNPLYIDYENKRVHLSRGSVGGTVMNMNHGMDAEKAIEAYKNQAEENRFSKKVTAYRVF